MIPKEQRSALALKIFIDANPQLLPEIAALQEDEACGETLANYRMQYFEESFEKHAAQLGVDSWDYTLQLIARSQSDLENMRVEHRQDIANALGIDKLL